MKNFYLILQFLYFSQLLAQIVNEGTLKIIPTTIVSFQDSYTNKNAGIHDNDGQLYLNSNFINEGTTVIPNTGTTYFNSTVNAIQTISGISNSANFYNLEINVTGVNKKGVSVVDNFGVFVKNQVNLVSGDLRLIGEAQLIQTHTGLNNYVATSGNLLRDQQGISTVYGYNYWSSPVNNNSGLFTLNGGMFDGTDAAINVFSPQQILFNTGTPYNGVPSILDGSNNVVFPLKINDRWLYTYQPSTLGYLGWNKIDQNTLINPGVGFTMKGTGLASQNYVFKGLPNDGDYNISITNGQGVLLGNPYPSSMDINKFINDNLSVLDNVQFWVDGGSNSHYLSDYLGGYSVYNLTGGVAPSVILSIMGVGTSGAVIPKRFMAVGQGFFVVSNANGNISFNNSQRIFKTEDGVDSNYYKNSNTKNNNVIESTIANSFIRIGYEDPEMFHRQLLLGFLPNSNADLSYNKGYDGLMPDPREDELFYMIDRDLDKKYIIQGVEAYDNTMEFPLGLIIAQSGTHTIMLDSLENFKETVYIKDTALNTTHNLSASNFSLNLVAGEYLDRFKITFKPTETLNSNDFLHNSITVTSRNNNIFITNKAQIKINSLVIFNMLGQKIMEAERNVLSKSEIMLPFLFTKGIYLVHIDSNQGKYTYKIINQ